MAPARPAPERSDLPRQRERLRDIIASQSLLQDRDFILVSGRASNFFFDMKKTMFDPEGEASFISESQSHLAQRTVILITHRPASLALADRVVRLEGGVVSEHAAVAL